MNINARDTVSFDGGDAFSTVGEGAIGNGGGINVTTGSLAVTNGAFLSANTYGQGNGGSVNINARDTVSFDGGDALSTVGSQTVGNGGDINITTGSLSVTNDAELNTSTFGQGNGGSVNINARDTVSFDGGDALSTVESGAVGNGGGINVTTGSLALLNDAGLNTSTYGQGNAGSISVQARDSVSVTNSDLFTTVFPEAIGGGGNIDIQAGSLSLTNDAVVFASTAGQGNAGSISVRVNDSVSLANSRFFNSVGQQAEGNGGNINIQAGSVSLTDGANVSADNFGGNGDAGNITIFAGSLSLTNDAGLSSSTGGQGNAGSISVQANDSVEFANSRIETSVASSEAVGKGGDISITTGSLSLTDGAQLSASTFGQGDAGSVNINARDTVSFDGGDAFSTVEPVAVGNGGDINITTGSLSVTNGAVVSASTGGQGDAGSVNINARDTVSFDGVGSNEFNTGAFSSVESGAEGNGGGINITARSLSLTNRALLISSTFSEGDAGNILVQVNDAVSLNEGAYIRASVEDGGVGNSGDIDIQARSLLVTNGAQVGAFLFRQFGDRPGGQGRGGEVRVNASDSVTLSGIDSTGFSSGLWAITDRGASGPAGNITVSTSNFRVADGAVVNASTSNFGNAGDITINAKTFEAVNGGQVLTNTRSSGSAGTISLNVTDRIALSGSDPNFAARLAQVEQRLQSSETTDQLTDVVTNQGPNSGLFANTAFNSTGQGGNLRIATGQLIIRDGAQVTVSSQGSGDAGNLEVVASSIRLSNQGKLIAETTSGRGGDITLRSQDFLLLRRNSQISATAGNAQAGGDGGNIAINTPFIVAPPDENSDITANAFSGRGGIVDITAQNIFGLTPRSRQELQTLLETVNPSELDPSRLPSNDITAFSQTNPLLSEQVTFNIPYVDPTQGLFELPAELVDVSNQIATGCPAGIRSGESEFIITGRGGLPPNPNEPLTGDNVLTDWNTLDSDAENRSSAEEGATNSTKESAPTQIVEANGWTINNKGEVVLTATAPTATLDIPWVPKSDCNAPEPES